MSITHYAPTGAIEYVGHTQYRAKASALGLHSQWPDYIVTLLPGLFGPQRVIFAKPMKIKSKSVMTYTSGSLELMVYGE